MLLHSRDGRVVQYTRPSVETPAGTAPDGCGSGGGGGPAWARADLPEDRSYSDEGIPVRVHQPGFAFVHLEPRLAPLVPTIVELRLAKVDGGHGDVEFGLLENLK